MRIQFLPDYENGIQKILIEISDSNGKKISDIVESPIKEELKQKIRAYVKSDTHPTDVGLAFLLGIGTPLAVLVTSVILIDNLALTPNDSLIGMGTLVSFAGGVVGGFSLGEKIQAKKHIKHIQHLFDKNLSGEEKRVSNRHFRTIVDFYSKGLLDKREEQEKIIQREHSERIIMGQGF